MQHLFRPKTCFQPLGYVDVLLSSSSAEGAGATAAGVTTTVVDDDHDEIILPVMFTTNSYDIGHYDKQQAVRIRHRCTATISEIKQLYWDTFLPYLDCYTPVKISDYHLFNNNNNNNNNSCDSCATSTEANAWSSTSASVAAATTRKVDSIPRDIFRLMPKNALRAIVAVQCATASSGEVETATRTQSAVDNNVEDAGQSKQKKCKIMVSNNDDWSSIDGALSVVNRRQGGGPTTAMFLGQENQMTMDLPLQVVFDIRENFELFGQKYHLYVAQETIVSTSSVIGCVSKRNRNDDDDDAIVKTTTPKIVCCSDGALAVISSNSNDNGIVAEDSTTFVVVNSAPLSALLSGVRVPSLILQPEHVHIHSVNLWYAPKINAPSCMTNTHYDSYHNLLLVVSGTKTVELCPPGTVQPSPFYSEHANHPLLYRPGVFTSQALQADDDILKKHKHDILTNTMVVSISAGEALYIPPGWWHRVESTVGCLAINVWFDLLVERKVVVLQQPLVVPSLIPHCHVPSKKATGAVGGESKSLEKKVKHMMPFFLRESAREYLNEHFADWAQHMIETVRRSSSRTQFTSLQPEEEEVIFSETRHTEKLCVKLFDAIIVHYHHPYKKSIQPIVDMLHEFLYSVDFEKSSHRYCVMKFFMDGFDAASSNNNKSGDRNLLTSCLLHLTPMACYIITQVWEKHDDAAAATQETPCGGSKDENENLVSREAKKESYYNKFFISCDANEEAVRSHLTKGVDSFKCEAAKRFILDDLLMGIVAKI